jgi:molecular chaperone GrpE
MPAATDGGHARSHAALAAEDTMADENNKAQAEKSVDPAPDAAATASKKGEASDGVAALVAALRQKLEESEKTRDEYLKLAKGARADFENYQIRAQRDRAEERRYAQMPLAHDLLAPLDNLERATEAAKQHGEKGALAQGVTMVVAQFLDVLKRHGITRIDALGHPFDPNLHQAVLQQPSDEHPPNTVVQVLENGYMMHERVLRPARVAVSKAAEPAKT